MRTYYLFILIAFFPIIGFSQCWCCGKYDVGDTIKVVDYDHFFLGEGRAYHIKSDTTVKVDIKFDNGCHLEYHRIWRRIIGHSTARDSLGLLRSEAFHDSRGKAKRFIAYYPNGNMIYNCSFRRGKKDGIETYYHENGVVALQTLYDSDRFVEVLAMSYLNSMPVDVELINERKPDKIIVHYPDDITLMYFGGRTQFEHIKFEMPEKFANPKNN